MALERLAVEPDQLFEPGVLGDRQVAEGEPAVRRDQGLLQLEVGAQIRAQERGRDSPQLAHQGRIDLQDGEQRRADAARRLEPADGPLAHPGQPRQLLLRDAEELAQPALPPPELPHPFAPLGFRELAVLLALARLAVARQLACGRALAHAALASKNRRAANTRARASAAWRSMRSRCVSAALEACPPTAMGRRLPETPRTPAIAFRSAGRRAAVVAESATRSGGRTRTCSTRLSVGTFAPRKCTVKPAMPRKSATISAPRSCSSPSTQATTTCLPLRASDGRCSRRRMIAERATSVARCSSATLIFCSCQSRPTSYCAAWMTSR